MQNRRMFLGSAAAAGVGVAVGGSFLFPAVDTHAQERAPADPVFEELRAQVLAAVMAIRNGLGKPGEHARRLAASVRLLNAHGVGAAADAELRRRLREEGRNALLAYEIDRNRFAEEMKVVGVKRIPSLSATYADRARILDLTAKNGIAATLAAVGAAFEQIAPALDRMSVTTVANRQDIDCWEWLLFLTNLEALMWAWGVLDPLTWYLIVWYFIAYATLMCSVGCLCVL